MVIEIQTLTEIGPQTNWTLLRGSSILFPLSLTLTLSLCVCLYHSQLMIWCCSGGYVSLFADCIIIFSTYLRTLHLQLHHHITDHNHSVNFCPSLFFAPHFRPLSILAAIQCLIILTFAKSFDHLNQYASVVLSFTSFFLVRPVSRFICQKAYKGIKVSMLTLWNDAAQLWAIDDGMMEKKDVQRSRERKKNIMPENSGRWKKSDAIWLR